MLAKKGVIPYRYPVSRNQYPVSRPNEAQTSLYGDETVNPKNIILKAIYVDNVRGSHVNRKMQQFSLWPPRSCQMKAIIRIAEKNEGNQIGMEKKRDSFLWNFEKMYL